MSAPNSVTLNAGSGGSKVGTVQDSGSNQHNLVVLEYWTGAGDPVVVNNTNPLPANAFLQMLYPSGTPSYTAGTSNPAVIDSAGNVCVNIKAGAAAGGTSIVDAAVFTRSSTVETPVGGVAQVSGSPVALTSGHASVIAIDTVDNGVWSHITNGITSGTAGVPSTQVVSVQGVASATPVISQLVGQASGGNSTSYAVQPATVAFQTPKGSAGTVYGIFAWSIASGITWLKLFDAAAPTLGTTACNYQFPVPGATSPAVGFSGFVFPTGIAFANAIKYYVSGAIGANDTTAITASTVLVWVVYV